MSTVLKLGVSMTMFPWKEFLTTWSEAILTSEFAYEVPRRARKAQWLGYKGATERQLVMAEQRLGITLPPSYRSFLAVTNGWQRTTQFIESLWPVSKIDWYAHRHQHLIDAWMEGSQPHLRPSIPDSEYLVYGSVDQPFRDAYLQTALAISPLYDGIYLLNPQTLTADGEWEAWFFAAWNLGAARYPSFWELMQAEYQAFLALQNQ